MEGLPSRNFFNSPKLSSSSSLVNPKSSGSIFSKTNWGLVEACINLIYKSKIFDEYVLYKKILLNAEQLNNQYFILVDNIERVQELQDEDILSVIDHNNGIYFGDDIDRNKVFNVANISQIDPLAKIDNKTYVIINGNALTLKGVGVEGEEED